MNTIIGIISAIVVIGIVGYFIYNKTNKKDGNNKSNNKLEAFSNELHAHNPIVIMIISRINKSNLKEFLNGGLQYEAFEELVIDKISKQVKEDILSREYFTDESNFLYKYKEYKEEDEAYKNLVLKVMDNNIRLSGQPTDMLRIKVNRDAISSDLISRTIISTEIIPVIFPNMEKVPLRRLTRDGDLEVLVPNLYQFYEDQYWTIYNEQERNLPTSIFLLHASIALKPVPFNV